MAVGKRRRGRIINARASTSLGRFQRRRKVTREVRRRRPLARQRRQDLSPPAVRVRVRVRRRSGGGGTKSLRRPLSEGGGVIRIRMHHQERIGRARRETGGPGGSSSSTATLRPTRSRPRQLRSSRVRRSLRHCRRRRRRRRFGPRPSGGSGSSSILLDQRFKGGLRSIPRPQGRRRQLSRQERIRTFLSVCRLRRWGRE